MLTQFNLESVCQRRHFDPFLLSCGIKSHGEQLGLESGADIAPAIFLMRKIDQATFLRGPLSPLPAGRQWSEFSIPCAALHRPPIGVLWR
jgi:hypothetical protein